MEIIVAGAGHGGLAAAAELAKKGFSVTVIEKEKRSSLGHDWEDRFTFSLLLDLTGEKELPSGSWRFRGDCAFVSPDFKTQVVVRYDEKTRQKIMWRKPLIEMLLANAEKSGAKLVFETEILGAITENGKVCGVRTADGDIRADLVIDSAGVFSPIRRSLPESFGIEKEPKRGDVFYAKRAYFNKTTDEMPPVPFEVYLCHAREQGLSWCCTNDDSVDVLIGRIDPIDDTKFDKCVADFRKTHPQIGENIVCGGQYGVIPVRRPLSLMVADGYAAVGDSAFMTTPMNGMGIDLSLKAGKLLAKTVAEEKSADKRSLWKYNREFHTLYGGDTAKNECLKNSLLEMPGEGVDFLFENGVIQASDLAGAGRNTKLSALLGKFVRGMRSPKYFFAVLGGIMKGSRLSKTLKNAPESYEPEAIKKWQDEVMKNTLPVTRKQ